MKKSPENEVLDYNRLGKEIQREIYSKSYYEFYKDAFCQLHPGKSYDENWHAKYICDKLQAEYNRIQRGEVREKDLIINIPFRASKSMIITIIFPIWCWSQDPSMKFITVSYSGDLALEQSRFSRDLMHSVWFQRLYGNKVMLKPDAKATSHYETTRTGMRKAVGTGGQITGSGADIIILDDPQNPKRAASEAERNNTKDFYGHTLYSRLNDPDIGVRIIVMQRLHEEDLTGHLLEQRPEDHDHICIPAEIDDNINPPELKEYYNEDGLFWPTRFNKRSINSFKKGLGLVQSAGQLQQRPAPAEGNLVKRDWFEILAPEMVIRNPATEPIHFILDTAYSEKQTDDPSGILAVFQRDDYIYVINFTEIWKPFPELVAYIDPYVKLNGYTASSLIYVEPKASGRSLVQQLRAAKLNIVEIEGDMLKDDKMQRLSACSATMQAGKMKLIRGAWNDKFLTQLITFPNAKHDEAVDTACYAIDLLVGSNRLPFGFL